MAVGFPVVQAALSGYSDWAMRVIARRLGAPYTLCEVMLDQFLIEAGHTSKNRRRLRVSDEEHPVGGQLMGANPEDFGPAALRLLEAGFDVIDINFGCPVKKVLGRCRGGYLLSQVETALEIVARVRDAVPPHVPVTVKMRRGLDDSPESRDKFFAIFDGAFARGIAAATVHGRTVEQRYIGPSRWEFLRDVKRHAGSRTVLGSGDLFTPQACLDMMRTTGVDGVTVHGDIRRLHVHVRDDRVGRSQGNDGQDYCENFSHDTSITRKRNSGNPKLRNRAQNEFYCCSNQV